MTHSEQPEVLVVGAGPVGLTMAAELSRHGIRPRIIDRLAAPSPYCRAIGVSPRTLEVFDDMGIARQIIDAGIWLEGTRKIVNSNIVDERRNLSDLPYAPLGVAQYAGGKTGHKVISHSRPFVLSVGRAGGGSSPRPGIWRSWPSSVRRHRDGRDPAPRASPRVPLLSAGR
jgi:hypothetical protein